MIKRAARVLKNAGGLLFKGSPTPCHVERSDSEVETSERITGGGALNGFWRVIIPDPSTMLRVTIRYNISPEAIASGLAFKP